MRLYIAEKPSVANAIAEELGVTRKDSGFIECGPAARVTWCFGHMLEQAGPDDYIPDDAPRTKTGAKIWRVEDLPIIPSSWTLNPKEDCVKQLGVIKKLLASATDVVNAGDCDQEGQLLVDEVLEHFGNQKPVLRFWVGSIDPTTVRRGLEQLQDNRAYAGWADAARARQRADWLVGFNMSRAYTLRAARGGTRTVLAVGRVQTPVLALVVARDREIEAFKPIPFHKIKATFRHADGTFVAQWLPSEDQRGLDSEGRMIDTTLCDELVSAAKGAKGQITTYQQEPKKTPHPLTFSLTDMTAAASAKWGYSAEDVLNICQSLYEKHKLTSYPRTDSAYLPEAQHADAAAVLAAIKEVNPHLAALVDAADPKIKSRTWNTEKAPVHHGIIPTMKRGSLASLSEQEKNLYGLIVRAYLAQFYPVHEYLRTTVIVDLEGREFSAAGNVVIKKGWKQIFDQSDDASEEANDDDQQLPRMKAGESVECDAANRTDEKTRPPARFTEGTLLRAMENIHKFVVESEHKKLLREGDGIGTPATRATILAELQRRGYLETKGKQLLSSALGRGIIDVLPEVIKSPIMTALWQRMLVDIQQGKGTLDAFMKRQHDFVRKQVEKANAGAVAVQGCAQPEVSNVFKCKVCSAGLIRLTSAPGKRSFAWWKCSAHTTCTVRYADTKQRPDYNKPLPQAEAK